LMDWSLAGALHQTDESEARRGRSFKSN